MNCTFTYKNGRVFKSELDLDEFLINSGRYFDSITDETFQFTTIQHEYGTKFQNVIIPTSLSVKRNCDEIALENPDIEIFQEYGPFFPKGTIPVTGALKEYRGADGKRLFPEFKLEEYWSRKVVEDWKRPDYWVGANAKATQAEIAAVFGNDIDINKDFKMPTKDMIDKGKAIIETQWAMQGFIGTGIHRLYKAFWDAKPNKSNKEFIKQKMKDALNWDLAIDKPNLPEMHKRFIGVKYYEIINDDMVEQAYNTCTQMKEALEKEFNIKEGEELYYMTEVPMVSNFRSDLNSEESTNLLGSLDLVIIDPKGNIHVIDYKTSPKPYSEYDDAKKLTFNYQLATYRRMIEQRGFNLTGESGVYVIPVQFTDFKVNHVDDPVKDALKIVNFSGIKLNSVILENLPITEDSRIQQNIDQFLPKTSDKPIAEGELLENVDSFIKSKFPTYSEYKKQTDEQLIKSLKNHEFDKPTKKGTYHAWYNGQIVEEKTFPELVETIKQMNMSVTGATFTEKRTQKIKSILKQAQDPNNEKEIDSKDLGNSKVVTELLDRYSTEDYVILDNYKESLERLGIILVQNIHSKRIDVIVCDTNSRYFDDQIILNGKNTVITGSFESDIVAKNKPNQQVLESTYGNIKLMQTMAALNSIPQVFQGENFILGEVTIFNQTHNQGITTSNEQLLYNFKELCKLDKENPVQNNFALPKDVKKGQITAADYLSLVKHRAVEIMTSGLSGYRRWGDLKTSLNFSDVADGNKVAMRERLIKLSKQIGETFGIEHNTKSANLENPRVAEAYRLLAQINLAIAELDGVKLKQQLRDHHKYLNQHGVAGFITKGWSANMLDNPGMLDSDTLNSVGKQLNVAYQNVRDEMQHITKKLFELDQQLKERHNMSYLSSRTVGNEASLYMNMYDRDAENMDDPEILFKNPFTDNSLDDVEREYLKYALLKINSNRTGKVISMDNLEALIESNPVKYLRVPLMKGSTSSRVAYKGIAFTMKDSFKRILPWTNEFKRAVKEQFKDLLVDEDSILTSEEADETLKERARKSQKYQDYELWEMTSRFDNYEVDDIRANAIRENGLEYFERNLSVLTAEHCCSYVMKENINKVFPVLKACAYQLELQGTMVNNNNGHFAQDLEYLHKFITAKVLNMSIEDPRWHGFSYLSGKVMGVASKLALAFNPRQLYQAIDGIWKDISLVARKPDGTEAFSAKNFKDSFFWAYKELGRFGDSKSMIRVMNELYGINDMDMNSYAKKIRPNQYGMFNFDNLMFHFASRPDFYNRMTIFGAKMRADGCFEAHDAHGNYDWTKDKRYEIFAKYAGKEDQVPLALKVEFNKQKALYRTVAEQFLAENAKYEKDGELVTFDKVDLSKPLPLPRAYTVQEAESIKSLADLVYGYYSHEKKSLIQSTTAGALFMQMNTFWSSKKNQYMAPGGIRMVGKWVQYEENGVKYYQDDEGNITDQPTDTPFMVWQGQYQEGIIVTMAQILKEAKGDKWLNLLNPVNIIRAQNKFYNAEDANMRVIYRNNILQFWIDLLAYLLLGLWVTPALVSAANDHAKDVGNDDFGTAVANMALLNMAHMMQTSTEDFNALHSIFGRGVQWTPFAMQTLTNTTKRISSCISGNTDLYDTMVKLTAATRTRESVFDYIKVNTLGRPIGDNGKD